MQTFAQALIDLVLAGVVERETAANASTNRHDFLVTLERAEKLARHADATTPAPADQPRPGRSSPRPWRRPRAGLRVAG